MTGRRLSLMLLTSLLVSSVCPGGWSTPVPGLAQDTRDAADGVSQEPQEDVADVSVFYEPLAPFGTWTLLPEYGRVWIPHDVSPGWRPYTTGRWVYTAYGWTWVSDQEWGWAPFHYGRWALVASHGWVWIPGTVWGPAWVVWRHTPGWVGWAPLPPQVGIRPGIEIRAANIDAHIEPSWFCFVEERHILAPHVITYIAPPARNVSLLQITQNVTHYTVIQNRVVNRGIPVERIERAIAQPVPRMRIVAAQLPQARRRAEVREREREVVLFRPVAPGVTRPTGARPQTPQSTPPTQLAPGTTPPLPQQEAPRRPGERQGREPAAFEERQRHTPPPRTQSLSPEHFRVRREAERRAIEDRTRRDRQVHEQQLVQPQPGSVPPPRPQDIPTEALQQRREAERRALEDRARRGRQAYEQQHIPPQLQQRQEQERQRAIPQQSQPQPPPQAPERQRAVFQPQHNHQPPRPQGAPPPASQQPRAATQPAPEEGREHRRRQPQSPPAQPSSQR